MKRHCLVFQKGGSTPRTLIPVLSAISQVVWAWPDPLPTGLNGDGKNVQTLWWAELGRLHSMTRAHPPLGPCYNVMHVYFDIPMHQELHSRHPKEYLACFLRIDYLTIVGNNMSEVLE